LVLFGRKKKKEEETIAPPETKEVEKKPSAPLFVRLDKYEEILNSLDYIKSALTTLKNSFAVLVDLEKLRDENLKLIQETLKNVSQRFSSLDAEFLRPVGFEGEPIKYPETSVLETTLADLKNQIECLKSQLEGLV
jgi:hypothetical protein